MTCTAVQARPDPFIPIPADLSEWFPNIGDDVQRQRQNMFPFIDERDGLCWVTGCDGHEASYMHEYIRRSAVMGWPKPWRVIIQCPYGSVKLCDLHHETFREPAPQEIADWMYDTYGTGYLLWLQSLPFKVQSAHPLAGWMRRHTWSHSS